MYFLTDTDKSESGITVRSAASVPGIEPSGAGFLLGWRQRIGQKATIKHCTLRQMGLKGMLCTLSNGPLMLGAVMLLKRTIEPASAAWASNNCHVRAARSA